MNLKIPNNILDGNILLPKTLFLTLKETLISTAGSNKAKSFLLKLGFDLGETIAKSEELGSTNFNSNIPIHVQLGHVSHLTREGEFRRLEDGTLECINVHGTWYNSFEASNQLEKYGVTNENVCLLLSGFASGYLSYTYKEKLITKEITCRGNGDPECTFIIQKEQDWLAIDATYIALFYNSSIIDELELTYDQLLHHKNILKKIDSLHELMTQALMKKKTLDEILYMTYEALNYPIVLRNSKNKVIASVGLNQNTTEDSLIRNIKSIYQNDKLHVYKLKNSQYEYSVFLDLDFENIKFKCSFILDTFSRENVENVFIFLDRFANVLSIHFLNQNVHFEAQARVKISILEMLINQQYTTIDEVNSYLHYLNAEFLEPYSTLTIKFQHIYSENKTPKDLYSYLIKTSRTFENNNIPILLIQSPKTNDELIGLISHNTLKQDLKTTLKIMLNALTKSKLVAKIGVSSTFNKLENFNSSIKESQIALKLLKTSSYVYYDDLGLIRNLIEALDVDKIQSIALSILEPLINNSTQKKQELLQTLYTYLKNDKKFEKTMQELSLSIGGLQYRLKKIENTLSIDLKDSHQTSYLLMLIDLLLATDLIKLNI